ncbi:hypothetical protein HUW62_20560 [Myxococcus sp. AM011]|uniref:hypothetical protein n=1 Tax=Myxococcus sp. AM011 TaxID=2745200 RepID=UPI00159636E1|nr:hypothetical protein [Myxococcus sp. AM011]NVJ23622.1 hypothetical protein [Myxococcus sp. AM011]
MSALSHEVGSALTPKCGGATMSPTERTPEVLTPARPIVGDGLSRSGLTRGPLC